MTFRCMIDGCGEAFATKAAKNSHRQTKHGRASYHAHKAPMRGLDRDFIYDMVDSLDLPDGAHWAMIEEMSGLEPGDFA